jgi:molybdopterin-guanine dinucleotide biosynthesis protein A
MNQQNKVTGVVLAGGRGQRMQQQDKGLVQLRQRPLVDYAVTALAPLVDELLISANRNQSLYQAMGYTVISDASDNFDGPLAGILAALQVAQQPLLLVMPCDAPLVTTAVLQRLLWALDDGVDAVVVNDGQRLQPVFLLLRTALQPSLQAYLQAGQRKLQTWLFQQRWQAVDCADVADCFVNVNTVEGLAALEHCLASAQPVD